MSNKMLSGCLMLAVFVFIGPVLVFAAEPAWWTQQKRDCNLPSTLPYNNWDGRCNSGGGGGGSGRSTYDYEAEQRAEAARRAEEARQAELERQRIEAENRRIQEEQERQAKFIRDRNEAAKSLRGSGGTVITPNTTDGSPLKGTSPVDSGLKGSTTYASTGQPGPSSAWKQLHCSSYIAGFALQALQGGDLKEFGEMSVQALKAMDGGRMDVECPAAPTMPTPKGNAVDMERLQGRQRQVLEKAGKIAERMKQQEAKKTEPEPAKSVPANETDLEKKVRVQKELNKVNQQKISGNQKEIDQQEKDRKELARLILENNGLQKGELINMDVSTKVEAPKARGKKQRQEPPSPAGQ